MHFNIKNIIINNGFEAILSNKNIYINLYESIKKGIINRTLEKGIKLPPTRILAKDLEISRSTVIKAYDLLVLEKYIKSIPGSGYYVLSIKDKKIRHNITSYSAKRKYPSISKRGKSFKNNFQIKRGQTAKGVAFRPGLPPLDIFPVDQWKNLSNNYWKTVRPSELSYADTLGLANLRNNISNYLKLYRNIHCESNQIVITSGSLHSLSLICDVLIDKNDEVVIENPTYPRAFYLLNSLKANIYPTEIDEEGIVVNKLKCKKPKLIYTTPSNQYPTGVKMTLKRRMELLDWASKKEALIIEDDYDHEYSNWEKPVSSIFSLDKQDRTVYLGTFNKLLHPSIRLGYMIIPHYLIDVVAAMYGQSNRFIATSLQQTLNDFIERDYLNKHLRNVIEISQERKQIFIKYFSEYFDKEILVDSRNTGLHLIGTLQQDFKDKDLASFFGKHNIVVHPYSNYFIGEEKQNGLVMGYSSVNIKKMKDTLLKMQQLYYKYEY